jgi:hypothetical protein
MVVAAGATVDGPNCIQPGTVEQAAKLSAEPAMARRRVMIPTSETICRNYGE